MSAASTRPKAPATEADTPNRPNSTALGTISAADRLLMDEARAHVAAASNALDGGYARQTTARQNYVADGHEAIRLIDAATRELHQVRAALVGEIRADEEERAVRIDRVFAELRARRTGEAAGSVRRDAGAA
jgi:hypothetical protein